MGIAYGVTTNFQATKGIVQDGLVLNLDAGVKESYGGSGTSWTDLKDNNQLTLVNSTSFDKTNGGSIVFDGTDEYASISSNFGITGASASTISCIFKTNDLPTGSFRNPIVQLGNYSPNNSTRILFYRSQKFAMAYYANDKTFTNYSPSANTIYHVAVTENGSGGLVLYVNGSQEDTGTVNAPNTAGSVFRIGEHAGFKLNGNVYACHIYNRALTAAEVSRNFNVMRHRFGI